MPLTNKCETMVLRKRHKSSILAQEPTEEDMARILSTEELVQLCRRTHCRVDMWKWNAIDILFRKLQSLGKFEGRSQKSIDTKLLKTYLKNTHLFKHMERKKQAEWIVEWRQRRKCAILKLDKRKQFEEQNQELMHTE